MDNTIRGGLPRAPSKPNGAAPYRTAEWKALRQAIFGRDGGLCQACGAQVRGRDWGIRHRRPHGGDPALFWAPSNLELECANCARVRLRRRPAHWIEHGGAQGG
jgi:5-methylcytosine-specific restriction endonuclease McrA